MAGYSGTPLIKKLGIKEGHTVALINKPRGFETELGELPAGTRCGSRPRAGTDLILFFTSSRDELKNKFGQLAGMLKGAGMLWVAWPKKASGLATDLSFEVMQRIGLEAGLVDTKICSINDIWSGLKFVIRVKDRPKT